MDRYHHSLTLTRLGKICVTSTVLAILCCCGCSTSTKSAKNMDRAAYLRTMPYPLQVFKVDLSASTDEEKALGKSFAYHAKMCAYGLPEYANMVALDYASTLIRENPHYLLFQKRLYDHEFRQCLTAMRTRAVPPSVEIKSDEPELSSLNTENTEHSPLKTENTTNKSGNSINRYSYKVYQESEKLLNSVGHFTAEQVLILIDDFYDLDKPDDVDYWIQFYRIIQWQNKRTELILGHHLFSRDISKNAGYGLIVNYVRTTGNISYLKILQRQEFVQYRLEHPELEIQFEHLQLELENKASQDLEN